MRNHRRGFTLVDVLISLSLMAVFLVLTYRLIGVNFHFAAATRTANDNSARFDDALRMLRADVFNSSSVEMPQANVLRVHGPGIQLVEWKAGHQVLSRNMGGAQRTWDVGHPVNLRLDGAVVLLTPGSAEPAAMASINTQHTGSRP